MDPLSLLAVVAGIVATAMKRVQIYNESYDLDASSSITIASIMAQCSCVEYSLLQVQKAVTQYPTSVAMLEMDGVLNRHFTTVFGACQMVFSILNERLDGLVSGNVKGLNEATKKARLTTLWNDQDMKNLLRNIESQASALNLLLAALQMRSNIEIHALLTRPKSVTIFDKVTDDASSLISRGDGLTQTLRMKHGQNSESVFDGVEFDFDVELVQTSVYRKALKFSWTRSVLRRRFSRGSKSRKHERTTQALEESKSDLVTLDERAVDLPQSKQGDDAITTTSDQSERAPEKQQIVLEEVEIFEEQEMQLPVQEISPPDSTTEISDEASSLPDDQMIESSSDTMVEPESLDERAMEVLVTPPAEIDTDSTLKSKTDQSPTADSELPLSPRKIRSALKPPGPKGHVKRTPSFSPDIVFFETWSNTEYSRVGDSIILTPAIAEQIKDELNEIKKEMTVHPSSKVYTHFLF